MNNTVRIAIACFVGAFIGSLVSLQLGYMWSVGATVGSLIAYLGFNIEEVVIAIPKAYRRTASWRPDSEYWFYWRKSFASNFNFGFNVMMSIGLVTIPTFWMASVNSLKMIIGIQIGISLFMGTAFGSVISFGCMSDPHWKRDQWSEMYYIRSPSPNFFRFSYLVATQEVPRAYRWLIKKTPVGLAYTLGMIVGVLSFMRNLIVEFFHLIHSELRLLCAVDAALGTTIGYLTGDALIGAIAGVILGVMNYEVISVRVLQVAGARSIFR